MKSDQILLSITPAYQTIRNLNFFTTTLTDLVSQVQADYEDVLSPAPDGGYALPVDHKGIRLKTGT